MSQGGDRKVRASRGPFDVYVKDIRRYALLTSTGERRLARRYRGGEQAAWEQLVQSNLRLVVKIARDFQYRGVPVEELVSEGNIGLMEAARRFDPGRGVRFACYASWWIRKHILATCQRHLLQHSAPVPGQRPGAKHVPRSSPTNEPERVRRLWRRVISLDEPRSSAGGATMSSVLESDDPAPDQRAHDAEVTEVVHGALASLSHRERTILKARFGLDGRPPRSLQEVGETLGCTREWIRQLENRAIRRVRSILERRYFRP